MCLHEHFVVSVAAAAECVLSVGVFCLCKAACSWVCVRKEVREVHSGASGVCVFSYRVLLYNYQVDLSTTGPLCKKGTKMPL